MTPDEIPELLKRIALADPRVLPEDSMSVMAMTALWVDILRDVPADYAMQAVSSHYATSPFPIKPSDISTRWRATVHDRMNRHTGTFDPHQHPHVDPDDPNAYTAALRAERHAVATGRQAPRAIGSMAPSVTENDISAMRQQKDLAAFIKQTNGGVGARCAARVQIVSRYPDLVKRVTDQLGHDRWNGYIPPEHDATGRINNSPNRRVLLEILAEAERRTGA